jgi:RNA polymerase sigma factor (sigma-70 family)
MSNPSEDNQIKAYLLAGEDEKAFQLLVSTYQKKLYYQIRRIVTFHDDADDVLQETLIKIWKNLKNFKWESALNSWLYRIATNECLQLIRKNKKRLNQISTSEYQNLLHADVFFDGDEFELKLQTAITQLPEKQRIVFTYKYFEDLKYEEIQTILGGSVGSLKASYHHAKKKIEEFVNSN